MPAIVVEDLHKKYGDFEAVSGISFEVQRGEIFGLLGPNGAGKTTTVEILEGYRKRSGGRVEVLGFDPEQEQIELKQRTGVVLQSCGNYPHATVQELLRLWSRLYPKPLPVDQVLDLCGLSDKSDQRSKSLSGGQLRRLDLALALIGDPDLIFLDEPTTGFDPQARRDAWKTIASLRDLGKSVLLTTHYLDEAQVLADRVAIIKNGRLVAEGAPSQLAQQDRYVVQYLDRDDKQVRLETPTPTLLLNQLTGEALADGHELKQLTVTRPTLEDVYLELTDDSQ